MRKNKKATILHIAAQKYNETIVKFLNELIDCSKDGIIYNFILNYQDEIINKVFGGNRNNYYECYVKLVNDKFIASKGADLHVLPWQDISLFAMRYDLKQENRRAYRKDTAKDQLAFSDYAAGVMDSTEANKQECWDTIKGIKIPRNFKDLLSGQEEAFTYTKEKIRYLVGLMAIADPDGGIKAFNVQYAHSLLAGIFERNTIALSTCYDVHNKLIRDGIIEVYKDPSGYKNLRINGYKEGFRRGYIAVPCFVFQRVFKNIETAAIKVFFDIVFKFNNGENGKGKTDTNKPVIFKAAINSANNKDSIVRHTNVLRILKKRSRSEIMRLFSGTESKPGLNSIFNIDLHAIRTGLIYIRMKAEYMISKSEAVKASFFNAAGRFVKKAAAIENILANTQIRLNNRQFDDMVENFAKSNIRAIKAVVNIVNAELSNGNGIHDIVAYMKSVYNRYMNGERIRLSVNNATEDIIGKLSDPYEYIWVGMEQ